MRALLITAWLLAACATPGPEPARSPIPSSTSAAEDAAARTACAHSVLTSFIDAFNRGDSQELASFFTPGERSLAFQWFFVNGLTPPYGPPRTELPRSFAEWHAAGERWRIVDVQATAVRSWHAGVGVELTIERSRPGSASKVALGKGVLECARRRIFAFAI